eukprot:g1995.t1
MAQSPLTREGLHECTLKYMLKGVARQLYDTANQNLKQRRMVTSVARPQSPAFDASNYKTHRSNYGLKSSPIKISSYAYTKSPTNKKHMRTSNTKAEFYNQGNSTSLQNMNNIAQQCLSKIRSFRTILIPNERFAERNNDESNLKTKIVTETLFEEAYAKYIIGKKKTKNYSGDSNYIDPSLLIHHFRHDFIDSNGKPINLGLQYRRVQQSTEIHQILENMWKALKKTSSPNALADYEQDGQFAMYENFYHRLAYTFPRTFSKTRQAFLELDWSSDHTVEVHLRNGPPAARPPHPTTIQVPRITAKKGGDEPPAASDTAGSSGLKISEEQITRMEKKSLDSPVKINTTKLFSKQHFKNSVLKLVELFGGPYTSRNVSKHLKFLYERLFLFRLKTISIGSGFRDLVIQV